MPSYPTVSLSNSCQHVSIRLSLSLSIILYIVWLLCDIVIKVHVDSLSVRHWLISLTVDAVLQMINFYLSPLNFSVVLWSRYMYMPVRCKAFCWGILSVRHWLISFQWMQCFKWSITVFSLAQRYSDQGMCWLGAKLLAEESFLLGIDWSVYSRCNVSNDQLDFFFALWHCDQGICQLGGKLFAEESFLLAIGWSVYSICNASNDQY